MEQLQRHGGTAGFVGAFCVLVLFVLNFSIPGAGATFADPVRTLTYIAGHHWVWRIAHIVAVLAAGAAVVFAAGLSSRLREPAPARARVLLYLALIGLGGYALSSFVLWKGGSAMASYMAKDQVAASYAWLALQYGARGAGDVGNAFVGAALVVAGWAIRTTGALSRTAGWLAIVTGVLTLMIIVSVPLYRVVELLQAIFTVVWLAWGGSELRRGLPG